MSKLHPKPSAVKPATPPPASAQAAKPPYIPKALEQSAPPSLKSCARSADIALNYGPNSSIDRSAYDISFDKNIKGIVGTLYFNSSIRFFSGLVSTIRETTDSDELDEQNYAVAHVLELITDALRKGDHAIDRIYEAALAEANPFNLPRESQGDVPPPLEVSRKPHNRRPRYAKAFPWTLQDDLAKLFKADPSGFCEALSRTLCEIADETPLISDDYVANHVSGVLHAAVVGIEHGTIKELSELAGDWWLKEEGEK